MTDKQIIIDGVDVSGCKHYHQGECDCYYGLRYGYEIVYYDNCNEHSNCHYKQLKHKEQECEELDKELDQVKSKLKKRFRVEAENEELKQECNLLKQALKNKNIVAIVEENEELKKNVVKQCPLCGESFLTPLGAELYEENTKLKTELEELKEKNEKFKEKFKRFFDTDNQECWDTAFLKDENVKYKQTLDDIEEFCLCYRENPVEGSAYDKILNIINKAKES